jgi:hypothetical protein
LSAGQILLSPYAVLGPVDPQIAGGPGLCRCYEVRVPPRPGRLGRGGGRERVAAGVVERSPRGWGPEETVVGEGGDEQPDAAPTSARLDDAGGRPGELRACDSSVRGDRYTPFHRVFLMWNRR